jgi:hypothetical protein
MSTPEAPIPTKFWAIVRWVVQNHPWVFFLIAIERWAEHDYQLAAIFSTIFVVNLFVASQWDQLGSYLQRQKKMLPYIAIGALGLILVGISLGALWAGGLNGAPNTGRIVWNFDDPLKKNTDYFLVMTKAGPNGETRIGGFQVVGKNTSGDPVSQFKGTFRVDHTNKTDPFYILANEDVSKAKTPFDGVIPTLPEDTYGIPGLADFKIQTFEKVVFETGKDGVPAEQFLRNSVPFTVILEYDGLKIERKFSKQQIEEEVKRFERFSDPANSNLIPRILRKPTAEPPKFPADFLPLFQQPPTEHPKETKADQSKGPSASPSDRVP